MGLPASGKSTLIRHYVMQQQQQQCPNDDDSVVHHHYIEYDDVQAALMIDDAAAATPYHDDGDERADSDAALQAWREARHLVLQQLEQLLLTTKDAHNNTTTMIWLDDNFHLRSMRKQVWHVCRNFATQYSIFFGIVYMDCPTSTCMARNAARARPVQDDTIHKLQAALERPSENVASWENHVLHLDGTLPIATLYTQLHTFVTTLPQCGTPLAPPPNDCYLIKQQEQARLEAARQQTAQNRSHQVDQLLRRCVRAVARRDGAQAAAAANKIRKALLRESLHNGEHYDSDDRLVEEFCRRLLLQHDECKRSGSRRSSSSSGSSSALMMDPSELLAELLNDAL